MGMGGKGLVKAHPYGLRFLTLSFGREKIIGIKAERQITYFDIFISIFRLDARFV